MTFIHIIDGIPVRDRKTKTKGHLHSIIGRAPDGSFIEQSRDITKLSSGNYTLTDGLFSPALPNKGGVIAQIDEREYFLLASTA